LTCPKCGVEVERTSAESAAERALSALVGRRLLVLAPVEVQHEEHYVGVRESLVRDGYRRVHLADQVRDLDEVRPSEVVNKKRRKQVHTLDVVIDRVVARPSERSRLVEALEAAFARGSGRASLV